MNTSLFSLYLVVIILLFLANSDYIQDLIVVKLFKMEKTTMLTNIIYVVVLFGIFALSKFLIDKYGKKSVENFFFEVSDSRNCKGLYNGKPTSFQFSPPGSQECGTYGNNSMGMINNNPSLAVGSPQYSPYAPVLPKGDDRVPYMDVNRRIN